MIFDWTVDVLLSMQASTANFTCHWTTDMNVSLVTIGPGELSDM